MRIWILGIIGILLLDQVFKTLALTRLPEEGGRLNSIISFRLHKNFGMAFDIPAPQILVIAVSIGIILMAWYGFVTYKSEIRVAVPLFLIIAGGVGNLFDRIVYGFTVDYIILFTRSAINLSDVMIMGGVLVLAFIWSKKDEKEKTSSAKTEEEY